MSENKTILDKLLEEVEEIVFSGAYYLKNGDTIKILSEEDTDTHGHTS